MNFVKKLLQVHLVWMQSESAYGVARRTAFLRKPSVANLFDRKWVEKHCLAGLWIWKCVFACTCHVPWSMCRPGRCLLILHLSRGWSVYDGTRSLASTVCQPFANKINAGPVLKPASFRGWGRKVAKEIEARAFIRGYTLHVCTQYSLWNNALYTNHCTCSVADISPIEIVYYVNCIKNYNQRLIITQLGLSPLFL